MEVLHSVRFVLGVLLMEGITFCTLCVGCVVDGGIIFCTISLRGTGEVCCRCFGKSKMDGTAVFIRYREYG